MQASSQIRISPAAHPLRQQALCPTRLRRHGVLQLRRAASQAPSDQAASSCSELLEWMQQQGCTVSGVKLVYETQQNGAICRELRASQDLSPGDVLISVPLHCTIHYVDGAAPAADNHSSSSSSNSSAEATSNNNSSSSSGQLASLRRLQSDVPAASDSGRGAWQFKMALEILYHYHQGSASPIYPYIQSLPGVYPGIPGPQVAMLYPEPQLQELQYAPLIADAGGQIYWWQQYSQDVLSKLPGSADDPFGGQLVTQDRLGWALSLAMSRAFGFKRLGGWALVPLVDMANHSLVRNAEIRCDEGGRVRMIANKKVSAGSPICLRYGSHDNVQLLLSYGFVLPDNPADTYSFPLDLDIVLAAIYQFVGGELPPSGKAVDGLKQWQRTTLQDLGLLPAPLDSSNSSGSSAGSSAAGTAAAAPVACPVMVSVGGDPPVSPALLAAVRVVLATERASVKGKTLEQLGDWHQPLSTAHEALVMKALVGLVTVLYKSFPTSIQADKALLADMQQQQKKQSSTSAAGDDVLAAERMQVAVQFRLGMKLLLERSTKALIVRLKELLQQ